MKDNRDVPRIAYYIHEGELARWERLTKRLVIATAISAGGLAAVCLVCLATLIQKH